MKSIKIDNIEFKRKSLVIKNFYNEIVTRQADRKIGILKELPDEAPLNIWSPEGKKSKNWFMFMYNNDCMPHAEFKNKYKRGRVACGALDASNANQKEVVGCVKDIWKDFEKDCLQDFDLNSIDLQRIEDDFWDYYIERYVDKFQTGVNILEEFIMKKRALMTVEELTKEREAYPFLDDEDLWRRGCKDYLKFLMKVNTVRGFVLEMILFDTLANLSGGEFIESDGKNESKGIDGFIVLDGQTYPASLKPNTFNGGISPVYEKRLIKYRQNGNDLYFTFTTGEDLLEKVKQIANLQK